MPSDLNVFAFGLTVGLAIALGIWMSLMAVRVIRTSRQRSTPLGPEVLTFDDGVVLLRLSGEPVAAFIGQSSQDPGVNGWWWADTLHNVGTEVAALIEHQRFERGRIEGFYADPKWTRGYRVRARELVLEQRILDATAKLEVEAKEKIGDLADLVTSVSSVMVGGALATVAVAAAGSPHRTASKSEPKTSGGDDEG